ncbi:MAG: ATP-binding cassette subfamily B protein [Flammeovirgaceae bacterium]|jgi:ATP-binding cassette subfamily B protein
MAKQASNRLSGSYATQVKKARNAFVLQQDQSDCGVACLRTAIRFFGGNETLEKLREYSGTDSEGTTMLGLIEGAQKIGFEAEGLEAESMNDLLKEPNLCILHITKEDIEHYVLYCGSKKDKVIIADPAEGVSEISPEQLDEWWQSRLLVQLIPTTKIVKQKQTKLKQFEWLKQIASENKESLFASLFLGFVIAGIGLSTAVFTQKLIDDILPINAKQKLILGTVLFFFLQLVRVGLGYIRQLFLIRYGVGFNRKILRTFLKRLFKLPNTFFENRSLGDLTTRINDVEMIENTLVNLGNQASIQIIFLVVALVATFVYSSSVAVFLLLIMLVFAGVAYRFGITIRGLQKKFFVKNAKNESNYLNIFQGLTTIKSYSKEELFETKLMNVYDEYLDSSFKLEFKSNQFGAIINLLTAFTLTFVIVICCGQILNNQLKIGEMVAVISLASAVVPSIVGLSSAVVSFQNSRVAFERFYELINRTTEDYSDSVETINHSGVKSLFFEGIDFRYIGQSHLFQNLNFSINSGQIVGINGESGAGKSTLLKLLLGFLTQNQGKIGIEFNDRISIKSATNANSWRMHFAYLSQETDVFNASIAENISFSKDADLTVFLKKWNLSNYFNDFPDGLKTSLGSNGINLSGGQKQMINLARVLYKNSPIYLLDEPTASMDNKLKKTVTDLIYKLKDEGKLILLVSHDEELQNMFDEEISV